MFPGPFIKTTKKNLKIEPKYIKKPMTLLIIPGIMPSMTYTQQRRMNRRGEESIVGSTMWTLNKNNGVMPTPSITRNSLGRNRKYSRRGSITQLKTHVINSGGWELNKETNKWTHESYPGVTFNSLVQNTKEMRILVPYSDDNDHLGLAYSYKLSSDGTNMKIYQNRWNSEEFDTRRGRRRNLWEEKKELRKKHAVEFQAYQENRHHEGEHESFENRLKERYETHYENPYNKDFVIN